MTFSARISVGLVTLALILGGCSTSRYQHANDFAPKPIEDIAALPEPEPTFEALSSRGNPTSYQVLGKTYQVMASADNYQEEGIASWYGMKFHGHETSNGEIYDVYQFSAAHKTLPLPSYVRVTRLDNQQSVIVRVNDRGPFHEDRIIDLSYAAAVKLGIHRQGTAAVRVEVIQPPSPIPQRWVQVSAHRTLAAAQQRQSQITELLNNPQWLVAITPSTEPTQTPIPPAPDTTSPLFKVRIGPVEEGEALTALLQALQQANIEAPLLLGKHQL